MGWRPGIDYSAEIAKAQQNGASQSYIDGLRAERQDKINDKYGGIDPYKGNKDIMGNKSPMPGLGEDPLISSMVNSAEQANKTNIELNRENREWNSAEAQKNRDWQEMMANTAHQREIADLRKAGLNPILTATGGAGAATPAGSSATSTAASVEPTKTPGMASSATALRHQKLMERKYQEYELGMMREQMLNFRSQRELNSANAFKAWMDGQFASLRGDAYGPYATILSSLGPMAELFGNGAQKLTDWIEKHLGDKPKPPKWIPPGKPPTPPSNSGQKRWDEPGSNYNRGV